jgi:hypothetical protein
VCGVLHEADRADATNVDPGDPDRRCFAQITDRREAGNDRRFVTREHPDVAERDRQVRDDSDAGHHEGADCNLQT